MRVVAIVDVPDSPKRPLARPRECSSFLILAELDPEHHVPVNGGADEQRNAVRDSGAGGILPESTKRLPVLQGG